MTTNNITNPPEPAEKGADDTQAVADPLVTLAPVSMPINGVSSLPLSVLEAVKRDPNLLGGNFQSHVIPAMLSTTEAMVQSEKAIVNTLQNKLEEMRSDNLAKDIKVTKLETRLEMQPISNFQNMLLNTFGTGLFGLGLQFAQTNIGLICVVIGVALVLVAWIPVAWAAFKAWRKEST